jgi:hypothetical protein
MIGPATVTRDRRQIPLLNDDFHRNLSAYGRTLLLTLGRHVYWASGAVRGAVEDFATYASGSFMWESRSADSEWRNLAEGKLYLHDRFCDISGPPHTMRTFRKTLVRAQYLDGDLGVIYVRDDEGRPYMQVIPSHRIASCGVNVEGGPWDGARIIDGVIVDDYNRPMAYRVLTGAAGDLKEYIDVSAGSMALFFQALVPGQLRGVSLLGASAWDVQDLTESKRWELLAQKAGAGRVFQEWNEDGEAQPGADHIDAPDASAPGTASGMWREVIDAGINTYFKSSDIGARIEAVKFDRPSSNQQAFVAQVWREAMAGARLSVDFNLDLTRIGGAPLRVLIDKINLNHQDNQQEVIEPACRRFDFFRLGAFIQLEELPIVNDWWSFEYQPGERLTADKKYDSSVSAEQIRIGVKTRSRAAMELGEALADVRDAREREADDLFARASRISTKYPDIPLDVILSRLETDSLNPTTSAFQPSGKETADNSEDQSENTTESEDA